MLTSRERVMMAVFLPENVDRMPYNGIELQGWPAIISRGGGGVERHFSLR